MLINLSYPHCHPERSEGSCMSYQHRNWVKVTTSYPKQAKKTSVKRHFLELRYTDSSRVTMLVIHTDLVAHQHECDGPQHPHLSSRAPAPVIPRAHLSSRTRTYHPEHAHTCHPERSEGSRHPQAQPFAAPRVTLLGHSS